MFLRGNKLFGIVLLIPLLASAQPGVEARLSVSTGSDAVPLNRTTTFEVQLRWAGELANLEFDRPETPRVSNFEITGSASSNWVGLKNGVNTSIKTFEYTLRPISLGMGYVEALRVDYTDNTTGERHSLRTDRLGIKIVEAVREPEQAPLGMAMVATLALALVLAVGIWLLQRYRKKQEQERLAAIPQKTLEEEALEELRNSVDLNAHDAKEAFSQITRIIRQYLSKRFQIQAQGVSSTEVLAGYREAVTDADLGMKLEEILQTSELAKFSGESGDPGRLARIFTLTESFLKGNQSSATTTATVH